MDRQRIGGLRSYTWGLPIGYFIGLVSVFTSVTNQRLGDLAAGTVVVRDKPAPLPTAPAVVQAARTTPGGAEGWDVSALTAEEVGLLREYAQRWPFIGRHQAERIARRLRDRVEPRVMAPAGAARQPHGFVIALVTVIGDD